MHCKMAPTLLDTTKTLPNLYPGTRMCDVTGNIRAWGQVLSHKTTKFIQNTCIRLCCQDRDQIHVILGWKGGIGTLLETFTIQTKDSCFSHNKEEHRDRKWTEAHICSHTYMFSPTAEPPQTPPTPHLYTLSLTIGLHTQATAKKLYS